MDSTKKTAGAAGTAVRPASPPREDSRTGLLSLPAKAAVLLVRLYQILISPWLGSRCRFHPTCSNYCIDALRQHGMVHGLWLGVKRICKCHPFHPGGCDPVPGSEKGEDLTSGNSEKHSAPFSEQNKK